MKKIILILALIISLVLAGCIPKCPESCDDNNICTTDYCSNETKYACVHTKITGCCNNNTDCNNENSVCEKRKCELSDEYLEKEAKKVAQSVSIAWQNKEYDVVYDSLIPELKEIRSKIDFVKYATSSQTKSDWNLIFDKVVLQDKETAYAYYTFSGELPTIQPKAPAIEMKLINNDWKLNSFSGYISNGCVEDSCNDFDSCTKDECNSETSFLCENKPIEDCCNSDYDCPYSFPWCDKNKCTTQCLNDNDCKINDWHYTDSYGNNIKMPYCVNKLCSECNSDDTCGFNKICSKSTFNDYRCVKVECKRDSNCGGDYPFCSSNHDCVMCLKDSDCNSVSWCEVLDCYCSSSNFCSSH